MEGSHQADTYLRSGSNELKVLEYTAAGETYGINILKVSRILAEMPGFCVVPEANPAVRGVFNDHDRVVPVIDLGLFLNGKPTSLSERFRVIVTEFFGTLNAFLVESVQTVHTVLWEKVMDAQGILDFGQNPYTISIVRPTEEQMILLLDYETIILELTPELAQEQGIGETLDVDGGGLRVLVAEDSSSVRSMLQMELEEHGFETVVARDGCEAIEMIGQHPDISLVVSDVEMPSMDGLALTKKIKDDPKTSHIPVIVYSSIGDVGMKERAKFLKAEEHITKLNMGELFEKISALLVAQPKAL